MSEIATLFERIKEIVEELKQGEGEEYKLYFSPYSNGYSSDDFLFLSEVSEDGKLAQKYFAEAGEFARIANNIPRSTRGIWNLSGENKDLLYTNYSVIIDLLSELNPSKEHLPKFYDHELYAKALEQIDPNETKSYKQFLELFTQSKSRLDQLKEIDANSLEAIILYKIRY